MECGLTRNGNIVLKVVSLLAGIFIAVVAAVAAAYVTFETQNVHERDVDAVIQQHQRDSDRQEVYLQTIQQDVKDILRNQQEEDDE